jgi:CRP/FNR family transcriptional regulator
LPRQDAHALDAAKTTHHFREGERLFVEGQPAAGVWCVGAGVVCVRRRNTAGRFVPMRLKHPGAVLGLRAFMMGKPWQATAEALRPTRACFISADTVRSLLSRNLDLALAMVRGLVDELSALEQRLLALRPLAPAARVAAALLELAHELGVRTPRGSCVVRPSMPVADLAAVTGVSGLLAARTLADMAAAGILSMTDHRLEILDLDRLRGIAEPEPG